MKKNVFIVRHGHADFSCEKDYERVLTLDGIKAVNKTAAFIDQTCSENNVSIDICISSAAYRTKQTSEIICFKNNIEECIFHEDLYSTVVSNWLEKIAKSKQETIVIVGHNPTLSQMINNLCGHEAYMQPSDCAFISLEIMPDGIIYPAQLNKYYSYE